jgi:solute carrier family 5 (sodium-coupled monocarboxylate transporter), member 8/12
VLLVGSIVSYLTGPQKLDKIDPELISPVIHRFLPEDTFSNYGIMSKNKRLKENMELNVSRLYDDDMPIAR